MSSIEKQNIEREISFCEMFGLKEQPIFYSGEESIKYSKRIDAEADLNKHKNLVLRKAASMIPDNLSGKRAIDMGCGEGRWSRLMADRGAFVVGVDFNKEILREAEKRSRNYKNIKFVEANMDKIYQLEGRFSIGVLAYVLNNFDNISSILRNIGEITDNEGEIIIISKVFKYPTRETEKRFVGYFLPIKIRNTATMYASSYTLGDYKKNIQENGFVVEEEFCVTSEDNFGNVNLKELGIEIQDIIIKMKKTASSKQSSL